MRRLYTKRSVSYLEMWRVMGGGGSSKGERKYNELEQMKTCRKVKKDATTTKFVEITIILKM